MAAPPDASGRPDVHHPDDGLDRILRLDPVSCATAAHGQPNGVGLLCRQHGNRHTAGLAAQHTDARRSHKHRNAVGIVDARRPNADGYAGGFRHPIGTRG